jgi:hypothetical protein
MNSFITRFKLALLLIFYHHAKTSPQRAINTTFGITLNASDKQSKPNIILLYSLQVQLAPSVGKGKTNLDHIYDSQIAIWKPSTKNSESQPQTAI